MMSVSLTTKLPEEKMPYLLSSGDGRKYVFGQQVATVVADFKSTGGVLELMTISGAERRELPAAQTSGCL